MPDRARRPRRCTRSGSTELRGSQVARSGCRSAATSATLHETVTRNAKEEFTRHRLRRAADHNSRARALNELQDALGLPEAPLRIECYDMSHLQGTDYVGSMVVLEDGLPNKREYRRFKVKDVPGNDDFAAMEEVLTRRLTDLPRRARAKPVEPSGGKFAYPPQLLLVDGGKGQLGVAVRVLERARARRRDPGRLAGQAVRGGLRARAQSEPVRIPRQSEALTCCSASATRPTASPSPSTASCGASG